MLARKINFMTLMYWCDDVIDDDPSTRDYDPGTVKDQPLILVAVQYDRRKRRQGRIKNYIYRIGSTREIVYKKFRKSPAVMKMGVSLKRLLTSGKPYHKFAVSMEQYADYILDNEEPQWLKRNDFRRIKQ